MKWTEERIVYTTWGDKPGDSGWTETVCGLEDGTYRIRVLWNPVEEEEDGIHGEVINEEVVQALYVCGSLCGESGDDDREYAEDSDHRERIEGVQEAASNEGDQVLLAAIKQNIEWLDEELREVEAENAECENE